MPRSASAGGMDSGIAASGAAVLLYRQSDTERVDTPMTTGNHEGEVGMSSQPLSGTAVPPRPLLRASKV